MYQRRPEHLLMTAVRADTERGSAELAVVMIGVFALLSLGLMLGVNWLAAQAASAAAQRALEIAQSPGGTENDARQVAVRLAGSSGVVTGTDVTVTGTLDTVIVSVGTATVLGGSITRTVSGPRLRFVPQQRR